MEEVAVVDHAGLHWVWRLDAIGGGGLCRGTGWSSDRRGIVSDNRDADIDVGPESFTASANVKVPCIEMTKADEVLPWDGRSVIAIFDQVESIAIVDHARLDGYGSLDAVGGCWNS
jgi:hypothetical protein